MNGLILLLGGGALVYWLYTRGQSATTTPSTTTPATTTTTVLTTPGTSTPTVVTTTPPPPTAPAIAVPTPTSTVPTPAAPTSGSATADNSLAGIYARVQAAAGSETHTPADWNSIVAAHSNITPPDPVLVWGPALNLTHGMSLTTYWHAMSIYLHAMTGMQGLGAAGRTLRLIQGGWNA